MNSIAIVDVETTGLDPKTDRIVEIGCVLFDVTHRTTIASFAQLVRGNDNACEAINRIPAAALQFAPELATVGKRLHELVDLADSRGPACWMAHRAEFDRGFLAAALPNVANRLPWLCSKFDCEWPSSRLGASCVEMALAHGVPVVKAHRALTDCELIASTLAIVAQTHDLPAMLTRAQRPRARFVVAETRYDEARNAQAKAAGFRWNGDTKRWERRMAIEDTAALPFAVCEVG